VVRSPKKATHFFLMWAGFRGPPGSEPVERGLHYARGRRRLKKSRPKGTGENRRESEGKLGPRGPEVVPMGI